MILAGDIGGTNTRLAFFEGTPDRLQPVHIEIFPSPQFSGPAEIVRKFLEHASAAGGRRLFRAAGRGGERTRGNHQSAVGGGLAADGRRVGHGFHHADQRSVCERARDRAARRVGFCGSESRRARAARGIARSISAGTGLGEAGLYADGRGGYHPFPSEGGHADFAPRNDLEMDLLRYLMGRFEHVSYERVLSGPGAAQHLSVLARYRTRRGAGLAGRADRAGRSVGRDLEIGAGGNVGDLRSGAGYFRVDLRRRSRQSGVEDACHGRRVCGRRHRAQDHSQAEQHGVYEVVQRQGPGRRTC